MAGCVQHAGAETARRFIMERRLIDLAFDWWVLAATAAILWALLWR